MTDTLSYQAGLAMAAVYLIQWLKGANWFPWLTRHTDLANKVVSFVLALFTAAGIEWHTTGTAMTGGSITITYPALSVVFTGVIRFITQIGLQEGFYRNAVKPQ